MFCFCKYCGFVGNNDQMMGHAENCPPDGQPDTEDICPECGGDGLDRGAGYISIFNLCFECGGTGKQSSV